MSADRALGEHEDAARAPAADGDEIRVAVAGAAGGWARQAARPSRRRRTWSLWRGGPALGVSLQQALEQRPQVVVDFTRPDTALPNALACLEAGVHVVIGTTGFDWSRLRQACVRVRPTLSWRRTSRSARC